MSEKCTHEESEEVGAIWLRCNACGHHFERPKKPMTEGAKTGDVFTTLGNTFDKARDTEEYRKEREEIRKGERISPGVELARKYRGQPPSREQIEQWMSLVGRYEDTLTEALKVAGAAIREFQLITDSSDYGLNNMNTVEGRVEYYKRLRVVKAEAHNALAALERIRNNTP